MRRSVITAIAFLFVTCSAAMAQQPAVSMYVPLTRAEVQTKMRTWLKQHGATVVNSDDSGFIAQGLPTPGKVLFIQSILAYTPVKSGANPFAEGTLEDPPGRTLGMDCYTDASCRQRITDTRVTTQLAQYLYDIAETLPSERDTTAHINVIPDDLTELGGIGWRTPIVTVRKKMELVPGVRFNTQTSHPPQNITFDSGAVFGIPVTSRTFQFDQQGMYNTIVISVADSVQQLVSRYLDLRDSLIAVYGDPRITYDAWLPKVDYGVPMPLPARSANFIEWRSTKNGKPARRITLDIAQRQAIILTYQDIARMEKNVLMPMAAPLRKK